MYWRHLSRILSSDLTSDHSHHHLLNWWIQYSKRMKSFCLYISLLKKFIKNNCFQCFQRDPALRSGGIAARCLGDKWGSDKLFMRFQEVRFIFLRVLWIENYKSIFHEDLYFYQYIYYFLWNLQVALDPSPSLFGKIYCRSFCNVFFLKSADFPTTKNRVHYQKYAFFIHPVWHRETSLNIWVIL